MRLGSRKRGRCARPRRSTRIRLLSPNGHEISLGAKNTRVCVTSSTGESPKTKPSFLSSSTSRQTKPPRTKQTNEKNHSAHLTMPRQRGRVTPHASGKGLRLIGEVDDIASPTRRPPGPLASPPPQPNAWGDERERIYASSAERRRGVDAASRDGRAKGRRSRRVRASDLLRAGWHAGRRRAALYAFYQCNGKDDRARESRRGVRAASQRHARSQGGRGAKCSPGEAVLPGHARLDRRAAGLPGRGAARRAPAVSHGNGGDGKETYTRIVAVGSSQRMSGQTSAASHRAESTLGGW